MIYSSPQYQRMYPIYDPAQEYEISLVNQWLNLEKGVVLKTIKGQKIFIIHPGVRNQHEGPDIFDSTLQIDGKIAKGKIECHLNSRDWFTHGHDKQQDYSSVILHVVRQYNCSKSKLNIPTVVLAPPNKSKVKCSLKIDSVSKDVIGSLHYLSELRWQTHVKRFVKESPIDNKKLLVHCASIFGKGLNREEYIKLSEELDFKNILQLSEQDGVSQLTNIAKEKDIKWHKRGVRPAGHPESRFPAFLALIRFLEQNPRLEGMTPENVEKQLKHNLKSYCGTGFITELLGNIFYPFIGAKAVIEHDIPLFTSSKDKWFELTLSYSYRKYDKQFQDVFNSTELRSFSFLQGLKALDKHYCQFHYCKLCPLKENFDDYF